MENNFEKKSIAKNEQECSDELLNDVAGGVNISSLPEGDNLIQMEDVPCPKCGKIMSVYVTTNGVGYSCGSCGFKFLPPIGV